MMMKLKLWMLLVFGVICNSLEHLSFLSFSTFKPRLKTELYVMFDMS